MPDELFQPFAEMFNEKFVWLAGEYTMSIFVNTSKESTNITKKYRFTIFESDSAELSKVKDEYKFGDGIFWDSGKYSGIIIQIAEA